MRSVSLRRRIGFGIGAALLAAPFAFADGPSRDESPVLVSGCSLSEFAGEPVDRIAAFRWNPATGAFDPIPFQLDQRVDEVFNSGGLDPFTETIYDVFGHDDGLLDDNDELAFLFGDAGPRAPGDASWVDGAEDNRVEVEVTSSLPGAPSTTRWVYLFEGEALPRSDVSYVQWNGQVDGPVVTSVFTVDYEGPWLLTGLEIAPPCGNGVDLIDRVKGRAQLDAVAQEDEEDWNGTSLFLGGLVGPIRAIRYVRGAKSAINTIHHDIIYRAQWRREINLRVHALRSASLYIDWLPLSGATFYSPSALQGAPVDGSPDAVSETYVPWTLTESDDGGLVVVHEVAPSSFYETRSALYRDDVAYDDRIPRHTDYSDDDDSAYGDSGVKISGISGTGVQAITLWSVADVLCAGAGDVSTGNTYRRFFDNPLQIVATPQERSAGAISTLTCAREGVDVVLAWQAVPGAAAYRVFTTDAPGTPQGAWTLLGETVAPGWRDAGAAGTATAFYSVVALEAGGASSR